MQGQLPELNVPYAYTISIIEAVCSSTSLLNSLRIDLPSLMKLKIEGPFLNIYEC